MPKQDFEQNKRIQEALSILEVEAVYYDEEEYKAVLRQCKGREVFCAEQIVKLLNVDQSILWDRILNPNALDDLVEIVSILEGLNKAKAKNGKLLYKNYHEKIWQPPVIDGQGHINLKELKGLKHAIDDLERKTMNPTKSIAKKNPLSVTVIDKAKSIIDEKISAAMLKYDCHDVDDNPFDINSIEKDIKFMASKHGEEEIYANKIADFYIIKINLLNSIVSAERKLCQIEHNATLVKDLDDFSKKVNGLHYSDLHGKSNTDKLKNEASALIEKLDKKKDPLFGLVFYLNLFVELIGKKSWKLNYIDRSQVENFKTGTYKIFRQEAERSKGTDYNDLDAKDKGTSKNLKSKRC